MYMPPKQGDFTPPPAGSFPARCYRVLDLGTQEEDFQGQVKHQHKILVSWELYCDERMDDGRVFTIGKKYTLSSHEKSNLRKDLESWRGKKFEDADFGPGGFNIAKLVGVPCMLAVTHNESKGTIYANISAIMGAPKGMTVPPAENPTTFFSLDPKEFNQLTFDALSDNLKKIITVSPEWMELTAPVQSTEMRDENTRDEMDDEIPF